MWFLLIQENQHNTSTKVLERASQTVCDVIAGCTHLFIQSMILQVKLDVDQTFRLTKVKIKT